MKMRSANFQPKSPATKGDAMQFTITGDARMWTIEESGVAVAVALVDPGRPCLYGVVLMTDDPTLQQRALAAILAAYRAFRERVLVEIHLVRDRTLNDSENARLARFVASEAVPDSSATISIEALRREFARGVDGVGEVPVVRMQFTDPEAMLASAVAEVARRSGVRVGYTIVKSAMRTMCGDITFTVRGKQRFRFWHDLHPEYACIPPDHPQQSGASSALLINGSTDAAIGWRDCGIDRVSAPPESCREGEDLFGSWSKVAHPFRADGKRFTIALHVIHGLTQETHDRIVELLLAALERECTYIAVSGGFHTPFTHPENVARRTQLGREAHGFENSCVWQYLTLQDEGKLAGAQIPPWFLNEHWPERYADEIAEWRAGGNPVQRSLDELLTGLT